MDLALRLNRPKSNTTVTDRLRPRCPRVGVTGEGIHHHLLRGWAGVLVFIARTSSAMAWVDIEDRVIAELLFERIRSSLGNLPERQRQVVTLRDIEGLDSKDVCALLEISEGNQRVLLYRVEVGFARISNPHSEGFEDALTP